MRFIFSLMFVLVSFVLHAQKIYIKREDNKNFIEYTVKAGDNTYRIAKNYGTTEAELNEANGFKQGSVIQPGQTIKVPVTKTNFIAEGEGLPPLYYKVQKQDNLYRLGVNFFTKSEVIQRINNKRNNVIGEGQELLIGYLKTDGVVVTSNEEVKDTYSNSNSKPEIKEEYKKPEQKQEDKKVEVKEEQKSEDKKPVIKEVVIVEHEYTGEHSVGYFEVEFENNKKGKSQKSISGKAATFKTVSGWEDKRYYILMKSVPAKTVVRITANNRTIYAKVLGTLPDIKENKNLDYRLSAASASSLGITDAKFDIEITYYN